MPRCLHMALEEAFETALRATLRPSRISHRRRPAPRFCPFIYLDLISGLKARFPQVHLKALTMVEIAFLASAQVSIEGLWATQERGSGFHCLEAGASISMSACVGVNLRPQDSMRPVVDTARTGAQNRLNRTPPCCMATSRTRRPGRPLIRLRTSRTKLTASDIYPLAFHPATHHWRTFS